MRNLILLSFLLSSLLFGQDNYAAIGTTYNHGAIPAIAGSALFAKRVTGDTFSFTVVDALPTTYKPFTVSTQWATGIAQKVVQIGNVGIFVPMAAGITYSGTNTGWVWNSGVLVGIPLKGTWVLYPVVRVSKSSVANSYQVFGGILIGWGW